MKVSISIEYDRLKIFQEIEKYKFETSIHNFAIYKAIRNNIMAKKTTELVLLSHKKTTKLVFVWPNMDQLCFKVLIKIIYQQYLMCINILTQSMCF